MRGKGGKMRFAHGLLFAAALPLLAGCGNSLSKDKAASLIQSYFSAQCSVSPIIATEDMMGPKQDIENNDAARQVLKLQNWFANTIENNPSTYARVSNETQSFGRRTVYQYDLNGHPSQVEFAVEDMEQQFGMRYRRLYQVIIRFCQVTPSNVNILDITEDDSGKEARVTFTLDYQLTPLAQGVQGLGFKVQDLPQQQQITSFLRRLDATGWQIVQ
jgi:hypothetical protein